MLFGLFLDEFQLAFLPGVSLDDAVAGIVAVAGSDDLGVGMYFWIRSVAIFGFSVAKVRISLKYKNRNRMNLSEPPMIVLFIASKVYTMPMIDKTMAMSVKTMPLFVKTTTWF